MWNKFQPTLNCDAEGRVEENEQKTEAGLTNGPETQDASDEVYLSFHDLLLHF